MTIKNKNAHPCMGRAYARGATQLRLFNKKSLWWWHTGEKASLTLSGTAETCLYPLPW